MCVMCVSDRRTDMDNNSNKKKESEAKRERERPREDRNTLLYTESSKE